MENGNLKFEIGKSKLEIWILGFVFWNLCFGICVFEFEILTFDF